MALSVLNGGEWAVLRGGCVVNGKPLLAETQMGDFPSERSHVQLSYEHTRTYFHAVLTHSINLHTCQDTGGGGNNKTYLIMLVPADTSHANSHA